MRNSISFVLLSAVAVGITASASRTAFSGAGQNGSLVRLQATRPGVAQVGHVNVSGNIVAGRVGAGTNNPEAALHVNGELLADTGTVFFARSHAGVVEPFLHPRGFDGKTYLTYGQNGLTIRDNSNIVAMTITPGGTEVSGHVYVYGGVIPTGSVLAGGNVSANGNMTTNGFLRADGFIATGAGLTNATANYMRVVDGERNCLQLYSAFNGPFPTLHSQNYGGGWAAWFGGAMVATAKSFAIDHPLDPENKYLMHSCVESDEMRNLYDGTALLDELGEVTVTMPTWFEALNRSFRYQLTAIGGPGRDLYVAEEIKDGQFKIAGGTPGLKVSWQVTGIRHDPYAEQHPLTVEVDKGKRRGKYISPESYGLPESAGGLFASERPTTSGTKK